MGLAYLYGRPLSWLYEDPSEYKVYPSYPMLSWARSAG
jgi:hypothetical protein